MPRRKKNKPKFWPVIILLVALAAMVAARMAMWRPPHHAHPVRVAVHEAPVAATPPQPQPAPEPPSQPPQLVAPPAPQILAPPPPAIHHVEGSPRIAIVIDDMGLNLPGSLRAARLPPSITLSYIPYSHNLQAQTAAARGQGHELLLHMPMEPMGSADPGPGALLTALPPEEQSARFARALDSFTGFDGVNNHMGSKYTSDPAAMEMVVTALQARSLFFLDSRTSPRSVGAATADAHHLPRITRDVFLDDDMDASAVEAQLAATERVARHKGYAVAIGHPHPATLAALEAWIPKAEREGFVFVHLNTLVEVH